MILDSVRGFVRISYSGDYFSAVFPNLLSLYVFLDWVWIEKVMLLIHYTYIYFPFLELWNFLFVLFSCVFYDRAGLGLSPRHLPSRASGRRVDIPFRRVWRKVIHYSLLRPAASSQLLVTPLICSRRFLHLITKSPASHSPLFFSPRLCPFYILFISLFYLLAALPLSASPRLASPPKS